MKVRDYDTSTCIKINHNTRKLLKLFCVLNDMHIHDLTNSLWRQYFFNNLASLENQYPDKQSDWDSIRELLHQNKI